MASSAPKLRGTARTSNRAGNLRRAQRQSAKERAAASWGEAPEVYEGGERDNAMHASGKVTEAGGRVASGAGSAAKAAGTAGQVIAGAGQVAGAATEVAGKAGQAVSKGAGAVGKALTATKIGAIVGAPLQALAAGGQAASKAAEVGGRGVKKGSEAAGKAAKKVKEAGQKAKDVGDQAQEAGRQIQDASETAKPPEAEGNMGPEGRLRQAQQASRLGKDQELSDAAKASPGGVATLDKKTGEVKEGIGGSSAKEAAEQNKKRREGIGESSKVPKGAEVPGAGMSPSNSDEENTILRPEDLSIRGRLRHERQKSRKGTKLQQSMERMKQAEKEMQSAGRTLSGAQAAARDAKEEKEKGLKGKASRANAVFGKWSAGRKAKKAGKKLKKAKKDMMKQFAGVMLVRFNWGLLKLTFGHSIYMIDFIFFIGFMKKYIGFYLPIEIPEVGEEWLYKPGISGPGAKADKSSVLIIKVFELVAMFTITALVILVDVMIIVIIVAAIAAWENVSQYIPFVAALNALL